MWYNRNENRTYEVTLMRMRKKKNGAARLSAVSHLLCNCPDTPITDSRVHFGNDKELRLEIGCGKGGFACGMSAKNPDVNFIAMERVADVACLALEKAMACADERPDNLRFIVDTADNLTKIFAPGSIDRIFLNFSDPWSKKGYAKRRLTHRRYLAVYFNLLKDGGKITFKTDNTGLFDFTLLEFSDVGITPDFVTRDLHKSERAADNVMTEYETNFSSMGMSINMVEVTKPEGFALPIPENLSFDRKEYR